MSVPNTNYQTSATGDGATTVFGFAWAATAISQVQVYVAGVLQVSGVTVALSTIAPGGTITFSAAPANNAAILIQRNTDLLQGVTLQDNAPLPATTVVAAFDKLTIIAQQLQNQINNCVQVSSAAPASTTTLATTAVPFALFGWDGTGTVVSQYTPQQVLAGVPASSAGNVVGPVASTANNLAAFNATNGQLLKDTGIASSAIYTAANLPPTIPIPQLRAYLVTAAPYTDGASTGNTTIYVGPLTTGNRVIWDDGTGKLTSTALTETSLSLGSLTSATAYSLYLYNSAGTWTLEADAWSNTTTPPTYGKDAVGRNTKPAATNKLLVAEFYLFGTGTVYNYTGVRHLQNIYNLTPVALNSQIATTSWAYSTAGWRASHADTTNGSGRVSIFVGSVPLLASLTFQSTILVTVSDVCYAGIGINSTTVPSSSATSGAIALTSTLCPTLITQLSVGVNYAQQMEYGTGTFYGAGSNIISQLSGSMLQ